MPVEEDQTPSSGLIRYQELLTTACPTKPGNRIWQILPAARWTLRRSTIQSGDNNVRKLFPTICVCRAHSLVRRYDRETDRDIRGPMLWAHERRGHDRPPCLVECSPLVHLELTFTHSTDCQSWRRTGQNVPEEKNVHSTNHAGGGGGFSTRRGQPSYVSLVHHEIYQTELLPMRWLCTG